MNFYNGALLISIGNYSTMEFDQSTFVDKAETHIIENIIENRQQMKRPLTAFQLYCDSVRDIVKKEFVANCPHVFEESIDSVTGESIIVEKIEVTNSHGETKRYNIDNYPITLLLSIFSSKWVSLDATSKKVFTDMAKEQIPIPVTSYVSRSDYYADVIGDSDYYSDVIGDSDYYSDDISE